jgi:glutathione S-transferase
MKLFYSPGACSLACQIALEEVKETFEAVRVDIALGQNRLPGHLMVHPEGLVPVLEYPGFRLTEATAILLHIGQRYKEASLLPDVGRHREARLFELLSWLCSPVHTAYGCLWRPERYTHDVVGQSALVRDAKAKIVSYCDTIERSLLDSNYASGDHCSVADPYLLVFFRLANRIGLNARLYPKWTRWAKLIESREAVQRVL